MTHEADVLCPCQSGMVYAACCEPFTEAPRIGEPPHSAQIHASVRHHLLGLARASTEMPELWFSCLDDFTDAEREALEQDKSIAQPALEHFVWDWFRKYSEARPISRHARQLEGIDLRTSRRLDEWGLAPWEPWEVLGSTAGILELVRLGTDRTVHLRPSFPHQIARKGDGLICRVLPHLGLDFTGFATIRFPGSKGLRRLRSAWSRIAREHGISVATKLRPDVHNELWHPIHLDLLRLHPGLEGLQDVPPLTFEAAEPIIADPDALATELDTVRDELAHQSPRQAASHEMGRHRLRRWLDRRAIEGQDVRALRIALGL